MSEISGGQGPVGGGDDGGGWSGMTFPGEALRAEDKLLREPAAFEDGRLIRRRSDEFLTEPRRHAGLQTAAL